MFGPNMADKVALAATKIQYFRISIWEHSQNYFDSFLLQKHLVKMLLINFFEPIALWNNITVFLFMMP